MVKLLLTYYLWLEKPWFPRPFCNTELSGCGTRNTWCWPDVHWFSWRQRDHLNRRRTISGIQESNVFLKNKEIERWVFSTFFVWAAAFAFTSLESYVSTVYFPGGFPESFAALSSYKTRSPSKATTTTHTTFFHGEKGLHSPLNWHTFYKWIHRKEPLLICTLSKAPEKSLA